MGIQYWYGAYELLSALLLTIYITSILYLFVFRIGYSKKRPNTQKTTISKSLEVSVIIPIYNENTDMIKATLTALLKQNSVIINLITVIKSPNPRQINMITTYGKKFHSLKIIIQKGKSSQNEAYMLGLRELDTKYTCILASDTEIKEDYLVRMLDGLEKTHKNVAFGLLYPKIKNTKAGKFTAIAKIFRQNITLKGREALGLGSYIPGAFAVYRTRFIKAELKSLMKNDFVMHDLGLTMNLYAHDDTEPYFIPKKIGTELEKSTFSGWILQHARWFMGSLRLISVELEVLTKAKKSIVIGTIGLILVWNILPVAIFIGFILSVIGFLLGLKFFMAYVMVYLVITIILLTLSDARKYGISYCILFWLVASIIQSLGIIASIYGFIIAKYHENKTYILFKR
jgi:cellulose synthase/poly-beta-1,6-N-acetylglucosamine synthase-like glycosyltransferase